MAFVPPNAPPPYGYETQQIPTATPVSAMNAFSPPPIQGGFPSNQNQTPGIQQQFQPQQPQYVQSPQPMQQTMPGAIQPFQGVPNMTPQQVQQVQQVLQSYPPEKLGMIQQQIQQVAP